MRILYNFSRLCFLGLLVFCSVQPCFAQEPVPRQWNHLPVGTNFVGVGYAYTDADILLDPVLLIEDAKMELHTWVGKYTRTFKLFNKSARVDLTQAYHEGEWMGLLEGLPASISRSGWSDTFLRLSSNLYGAPPLSGKKYAAYRSNMNVETIIGMALVVRLPTGEYMEDKLINLGQNRFTFVPQFGVIHNRGKWTTELTGEISFYTDNDEFFNGKVLEQKPIYFIHSHLMYTFRPGFWMGASLGYFTGGANTVNGIDKDDKKQNIAWALSLAYPINRYTGIKVAYIGTRAQELTGIDFDTFTAGLSYFW